MVNRANFRKLKEENNSQCWYCQGPTNSSLTFKDGSEIWACKKCAANHGKVKRLKNMAAPVKSLENSEDLHKEIQEDDNPETDIDEDYCPQCKSYVKSENFIMSEWCCVECHGRNSI